MTETAILKTAAHELTHFIQANSAQYEALKSFVVNKLTHEEGVSFEDLVADKQRREPGLEYNEAVDEVVADACEMMLGDSTVVEQLAKENRSLAEKIRDWLREWVENLKLALEGLQADRTESRAMMQYARELQEIWDNALMDAARNNRGTVEETAPAEVRKQTRIETGESIEPGEKTLKGKHGNDKMGAVKDSLKEDMKNGKARKEDRGAFLRRATGEGLRVFEGDSIAYGYRTVPWGSAGENARQVQKELTALGIDAEITDGYVYWNLDGISCKRAISQAVTIERRRILISNRVSLPSKNAAGHEAFHFWGSTQAREGYANEVADNLNFSSKEFVEYQAVIAEAYLGGEADLSDSTQLQKIREELLAYISGDIHEGVNDDLLRPMFRDYDAVKAAWVKLCKDRAENKVQSSMRDSAGRELTEAQQAYFKDSKVRDADGNLKLVYHGSAAIFTKFSADFMSQNGSSEGQGFYFTDYKPMAQGYEKNGGQLLEGYLDIKKPLSDSEVTLTAAEVKRLIRAVDPTGDDLLQRKLQQLDEANAELEALKEERKVLLAGRKVKELTRDEQFDLAQNRNRTETQKGKMFVNRIQRVARNNIS